MKNIITLFVVLNVATSFAQSEVEYKPRFSDKTLDAITSSNYTNALLVLNEQIAKAEEDLQILYQVRGTRYLYLNELEKARDDYIKALPCSVKGDVERLLGKTYEKLGEPEKAIFYLDKSIELAEDELPIAFARYYKSRALASLGKFSEAKEVLLQIESNETTSAMMSEVQIMIDFCSEQERKLSAVNEEKIGQQPQKAEKDFEPVN